MSVMDSPGLHSVHVPESDIGMHFGSLLDKQEGSDVVFDVSGEKIHAHKLVLAARSPIFHSLFFDGLDDERNEIVVTDMAPKVFKVWTFTILLPLFSCYFVLDYSYGFI